MAAGTHCLASSWHRRGAAAGCSTASLEKKNVESLAFASLSGRPTWVGDTDYYGGSIDANCGREHGAKTGKRFGYDKDGSPRRGSGSSRGHPIIAGGCGGVSKEQQAPSSGAKGYEKAQKTRSREQTQPLQVTTDSRLTPKNQQAGASATGLGAPTRGRRSSRSASSRLPIG